MVLIVEQWVELFYACDDYAIFMPLGGFLDVPKRVLDESCLIVPDEFTLEAYTILAVPCLHRCRPTRTRTRTSNSQKSAIGSFRC